METFAVSAATSLLIFVVLPLWIAAVWPIICNIVPPALRRRLVPVNPPYIWCSLPQWGSR
jgi:hypothetical protein